MQQFIDNLFRKLGSLDLAHKVFLGLFLFNVFAWSGVLEQTESAKITKRELVCDSYKWEARTNTQRLVLGYPAQVAFFSSYSREGLKNKPKLKNKLKNRLEFKITKNKNTHYKSELVYLSLLDKVKIKFLVFLSFDFKDNLSNSISIEITPLRGPPTIKLLA
jgi:hypothetical protein